MDDPPPGPRCNSHGPHPGSLVCPVCLRDGPHVTIAVVVASAATPADLAADYVVVVDDVPCLDPDMPRTPVVVCTCPDECTCVGTAAYARVRHALACARRTAPRSRRPRPVRAG